MRKTFLILFVMASLIVTLTAQNSNDGFKFTYYGQYANAVKGFNAVISNSPGLQDGYYHLGALYVRLNNPDSARICMNKVMAINPKNALSQVATGQLALSNKNPTEAKVAFDKAIKISKNKDPRISQYIGEAWLYAPVRNLDNAATNLKRSLALDVRNAPTYFSLGEVYSAQGQGGAAVTQYEFCTDNDKSAAWAYSKIGYIFKNARNYIKADQSFKSALEADPNYPGTYKELADWNYDYQKYAEALANYEKYLSMTGDNSIESKINYSSYLFYNKKYEKTINLVNEIMKVDSSRNYMTRLLGYCHFEQGDSLQALNFMNKFMARTKPEKIIWSDYQYLAKIYNKFGNDSLVVLNYDKALATDTTKVDLYTEVAQYYYSKGNFNKAASVYQSKLSKLEKVSLQNYFDIAFAYYKGANYESAKNSFAVIAEKFPTVMYGWIYQARSSAFLDPESTLALAKPYYEKVIELGEVDPVKFKTELKEAYRYAYYLAFNSNDKESAKLIVDKLLKVDPNDAESVQMAAAVQ